MARLEDGRRGRRHPRTAERTLVVVTGGRYAYRRPDGVTERAALLRTGLETLIRVESARRLAALGGSDGAATAAPRRRPAA